MKFDWSNYLALAENLLDEVINSLDQEKNFSDSASDRLLYEAKLRCAISRAYYSSFCLARNYLRDIEEDYELKKSKEYGIRPHRHVIEQFRRNNKKGYKDIGMSLERLLKLRHEADYEDVLPLNTLINKAKTAIKLAEKVIEQLRNFNEE
jgi:uncharacterized protein (UPF0332 family)